MLKSVVDQKRIEELPLNGRNPTQLMRLIVGTATDWRADTTSGTTYPGVRGGVSVNGSRANAVNYILDGAQNNDHYSNAPNPMPNPDALNEFSVQTNNFSAEFGRQSGGIVNAVTKSGTNEFHGSGFWFVRNQAVNAANFFAPDRQRREAPGWSEAQSVRRYVRRSGPPARSCTTAGTRRSSSSATRTRSSAARQTRSASSCRLPRSAAATSPRFRGRSSIP